jgi:thiol-disulfide isomerase/thioredoxin
MAPKKNKSRKSKRVRRSTAGKILPPLDVRSNKQLKEFEQRIKQGGITIVLVWAPWCGHCHKFMPHFDAAAKSPSRSIQAVKVEETMLPAVNAVLTNNINRKAKPLSVEGYPSLIIVDKHGNAVTSIEAVKNTDVMTNVMNNAGAFAEDAEINVGENIANLTKTIPASLPNIRNGFPSTQPVINLRSNNTISIGAPSVKAPSIREPSIKAPSVREPSIKAPSIREPSIKAPSVIKPVAIPSATVMPTNTINTSTPPPSIPTKILEDEGEIVSLSSPLTISPSNPLSDSDESISNSLTPEQRVRGGGHGGSLYSSLLRTTYTLAPAAALLATASMVMKKSKRTKRLNKKSRKTRKMRKN